MLTCMVIVQRLWARSDRSNGWTSHQNNLNTWALMRRNAVPREYPSTPVLICLCSWGAKEKIGENAKLQRTSPEMSSPISRDADE